MRKLFYALSLFCMPFWLVATDLHWACPELKHRVKLDWNPADGRACETRIYSEDLAKLAKSSTSVDENSIRVVAQTSRGEIVVPMSIRVLSDKVSRVRYMLPEQAVGAMLYFGGKVSAPSEVAPVGNLFSDALKTTGWKTTKGQCTISNNGSTLQLSASATTVISKDFPIPEGTTPGSPVLLDFAVKSSALFAWNFSLCIR